MQCTCPGCIVCSTSCSADIDSVVVAFCDSAKEQAPVTHLPRCIFSLNSCICDRCAWFREQHLSKYSGAEAGCLAIGTLTPGTRSSAAHLLALQHVVVQCNLVHGRRSIRWAVHPLEVLVHRVHAVGEVEVVRPASRTRTNRLAGIQPWCMHSTVTCVLPYRA